MSNYCAELDAVLDTMGIGIIVVESDGAVRSMNRSAASLYGYEESRERPRNLLRERLLFEAFDSAGEPVRLRDWPIARALRGQAIVNEEIQVRRKDSGQEWTGLFSARPVFQPDGTLAYVILTINEITGYKQIERKLQEQENILQAVIETSSDLIKVKDLDCRVVLANPASLEAIGRSEEEVVGRNELEFEDDANGCARELFNDLLIMESGEPETVEETVDLPDGRRTFLTSKTPYYNGDGTVAGLVDVSRDITESKRNERAWPLKKVVGPRSL